MPPNSLLLIVRPGNRRFKSALRAMLAQQEPDRSALGRVDRFRRKEPFFDRVEDQMRLAVELQLLERVRAVGLRRPRADTEAVGDLRARAPLRGEVEHLALAVRQRLV